MTSLSRYEKLHVLVGLLRVSLTVIGSGRVRDPVLVADGDSREPHLIDVLNAQIDAHRARQEVTDAVLYLEQSARGRDDHGDWFKRGVSGTKRSSEKLQLEPEEHAVSGGLRGRIMSKTGGE